MKTSHTILLVVSAAVITAAEPLTPFADEAPETYSGSANVEASHEVEVRAGTDDSKATIKGAYGTETTERGNFLTVAASAPLTKGSDYTQLRTFDGFANAFALAVGGTFYRAKAEQVGGSPTGERGPVKVAGFTASYGFQRFTFLDPADLTEDKVSRESWSAGAFVGKQLGGKATFLLFGVEYKEVYKDEKAKGVVLPPDDSGRVFVASGPYGPPVREEQMLVSADLRKQLTTRIASGVKVTYDFESKEAGVDVPVMFLSDGTGKRWTGGIQVGYSTKEDEFYAAVIVGTPFQIIPK